MSTAIEDTDPRAFPETGSDASHISGAATLGTLPSAGFHYGVPFEDYCKWPAINIHGLMPMDDSPAHCLDAKNNPKAATTEMDVGSAVHVSVFEPARLEKEFYFGKEEYNKTTREGKAIYAEEMQAAAGRKYIRKKAGESVDCDSVLGISAALHAYAPTRRYLEMPGQCEVCVIWKDPITGLMCKGRFDKFIPANVSPLKRSIIGELKTTGRGKAKAYRFGKEIAKLFYHAQACFYSWGVEVVTGEQPLHVFLLAENVAPYVPNWGALDDDAVHTGKTLFREWLNQYAECSMTGEWPGYPTMINGRAPLFSLPRWASKETYEEEAA